MNNDIENIIWIDRGIMISLIYIILKKYNKIQDKYLIVRQNRIRNFLSFLFPKLRFINNEKNRYNESEHKDYYYIHIRTRPYSGEDNCIVIDYLSNYNRIIPTDEIWLVPYYDKNDPLIFYFYEKTNIHSNRLNPVDSNPVDSNESNYLEVLDQYKIINDFTTIKRKNYEDPEKKYNGSWDLFFETGTINRYLKNSNSQRSITLNSDPNRLTDAFNEFLRIFNKYLNNVNFLNDYTPTISKQSNVAQSSSCKSINTQQPIVVPIPVVQYYPYNKSNTMESQDSIKKIRITDPNSLSIAMNRQDSKKDSGGNIDSPESDDLLNTIINPIDDSKEQVEKTELVNEKVNPKNKDATEFNEFIESLNKRLENILNIFV